MAAAEPVRDLSLHEYGSVDVSGLTAAQVAWLRAQEKLTVTPLFDGGVRIAAGDSVGTLIGGGLRVRIRPKVPLANLFYMLSYAYDVPKLREPLDPLTAADDLFDLIVTFFRRNVEQLVRQGIYRAYVGYDERQPYLRGRLLLAQQVRRAPPTLRFDQHITDLTADILENQILQHTLWRLSRVPALWREHAALRRALGAFAEVTPVPLTPADCDDVRYHRLNQRYQTPIGLARLLLAHLSLENDDGRQPFATFLLPMSQVFEKFIGRYLQEALPAGWSATLKLPIHIDADGHETGELDVLLRADGRPLLVLDTKYKRWSGRPSPADRNQLFMYCRSTALHTAVLLYPEPLPVVYQRALPDGVTLHARGLDLGASLADLRAACDAFIRALTAEFTSP